MTQQDGLLDNLVSQFSNPLDCVRELVQNAMDAGSPEIEVWTEFVSRGYSWGTLALHVDDWGEGMDEQVIDTYLTRLFSSSKDNDLTKIGKFGIGFVSIFALEPQAVVVRTGRSGEYWELVFHEDRTFTKTRLDTPVEGTQITLLLQVEQSNYADRVQEIRERLKYWCGHSETEITFEDRTPTRGGVGGVEVINQPFGIDGYCAVRVAHQGTEIACAYQRTPTYELYNAGLLLARTPVGVELLGKRAHRLRFVGFKVKSRYLEHTLSRETVMRDENYEKAMRLLDQAVEEHLVVELGRQLEALAAKEAWMLSDVQTYGALMGFLGEESWENMEAMAQRPIIRALHGPAVSLAQVCERWARDGRILLSEQPGELTAALVQAGGLVIYGKVDPPPLHPLAALHSTVGRYLKMRDERSIGGRVRGFFRRFTPSSAPQPPPALEAPEAVYLPVILDATAPAPMQALLERAQAILAKIDAGYRRLTTCQLVEGGADFPFFVVASQLGTLMARPPERVARGKQTMDAAVNRDHPHFIYLLAQFERAPELAAYCLAKSLLLTEDRLLDQDLRMIQVAQK